MKKANGPLGLFILVAAVLAGCGGGDKPCSTESTLFVGMSYDTVPYQLGVPFSVTPLLSGIPDSCKASQHFSITPAPVFGGPQPPLPDGVTLNPSTGAIAGTLAVPLGRCVSSLTAYLNTTNPACAVGGTFENAIFNVSLSLPGYSDLKRSVHFANP